MSAFVISVSAAMGWLWYTDYLDTPVNGTGTRTVYIPFGSGVRQIKDTLAKEGVIKDDIRFLLMSRYQNRYKKLKAGEYQFQLPITPKEVFTIIESGKVVQHRITIPEGLTVKQIATIIAGGNYIKRDKFINLCTDQEFIKSLGLDVSSLEGYLYPDTYLLTREKLSARAIITMMVKRFQDVWSEVSQGGKKVLDFDRHQIVTLASIVEKETGAAHERPLIAGVFLNRLEKKMRLQSDPTVIYGIKDFDGNIRKKDLRTPTPYNTYTLPALPAGPICNPGKEALKAVFQPQQSNYLYFVSRNDGTHVFSTNLKDHNRAVRTYQK